jgi:hypothetical protein
MTNKEELTGFKTACRSCIFIEQTSGLTQTGCQVGRLEIFQKHNRAHMDTDSTYVIDGICNTCRGEEWYRKNLGVNHVSTVLKEIEVRVDVVLYSINDVCDNLSWKIGQAVGACVKQEKIHPIKIVIVVKNERAQFKDIYDTIQMLCEPYNIPFQLVRVMEEDADVGRCIEMGMDKCTNQYTATFDVEDKIPLNFINRLNKLVNENLRRILLVEPITGYSGMIFVTGLSPMLGKNYNFPLFEKIKEVATEQKKEHLIITWESL